MRFVFSREVWAQLHFAYAPRSGIDPLKYERRQIRQNLLQSIDLGQGFNGIV
jgi:hypothetical protein